MNHHSGLRNRRLEILRLAAARFANAVSGDSLIEYALVAVIIALGAVASMQTVGCDLSVAFNNIGNAVSNAI